MPCCVIEEKEGSDSSELSLDSKRSVLIFFLGAGATTSSWTRGDFSVIV